MPIKHTTVKDDSYRTEFDKLPKKTPLGDSFTNISPGDTIKVKALRKDDKTGLVKPDDKGFVLFQSLEKVAVLLENENIVIFHLGDELEVIKQRGAGVGNTFVFELWHETEMWNEGFELAQVPYVSIPLNSQEDTKKLIKWFKKLPEVTVGKDSYSFRTEMTLSAQKEVLDKDAAKKLVKAFTQSWNGI